MNDAKLPKDSPDYIRWLIDTRDDAVERAVLAIFSRQEPDEQAHGTTHKSNGVGFSSFDAPHATRFAKWIKSGNQLSGWHLDKARKMMRKYVRQLAEIASARIERESIQSE
jgi:hypothetical protein